MNCIYYLLRTSPKGPKRDTSVFFIEGAFNAIDLTILAGLTSIYFNQDLIGFWSILPNSLLFLCYLAHVTIFGVFIARTKDRETKAANAAYFSSLFMSLVVGAVGIESIPYLLIGICTILICVSIAMVIPNFPHIGRLAPYLPATSIPRE